VGFFGRPKNPLKDASDIFPSACSNDRDCVTKELADADGWRKGRAGKRTMLKKGRAALERLRGIFL